MVRWSRCTEQSRLQLGQGCSVPSKDAFFSRSSSMVPLATARAAVTAACSIASASRSSSGPTSSWTRRATIFPPPPALLCTFGGSIEDDLRNGITCPSLDFRELTIWENRVDILHTGREDANRYLHPSVRLGK